MRTRASIAARVRAQPHALSLAQAEARDVVGAHQHVVARCAGQRVALVPDHAVELLAAARADAEAVVGQGRVGRVEERGVERDRRGVRATVRRREVRATVALAESRAAPLHLVALRAQRLDAGVDGHRARDLAADRRGVGAAGDPSAFGVDAGEQIEQHLPLAARFADAAAGDLGREHDAAFGRGLRAAARLFVARRRGQQQHGAAGRRIDQHRRRHDQVLVHAQRHARKRRAHGVGSGSVSTKLPPMHQSRSMAPAPQRVDHLARRAGPASSEPGSPTATRSGARPSAPTGTPPGKRVGNRADLGAALHAAVTADRHQARLRATDHAAREREVHDRLHVVDALGVLGDPHAPHEDRRSSRSR